MEAWQLAHHWLLAQPLMKEGHAKKAAYKSGNALCIIGATMSMSELNL